MKAPHPQSRASLIALNRQLYAESVARKKAMDGFDFKGDFSALYSKHIERKALTPAPVSQGEG